ncbi:aminodeoxychorismate lyase [uncultured Vibrio sp.]|uniref:aminodeoxychorismate lyase n=1 Tax=uncultured Vibrio sp. TaxID=114054 RepID=UPI000911AA11|nr:aminodeoxychorismate lyase [uncultured Vibrio sp.]OIQ24744.1 MAG: aminodeoxychorismate lyase [Vibrio sp. MedPE-SWchi]
MFWVNGYPSNHISLTDRSFQYGDGCFTTILTCRGELVQWALHRARMEKCLTVLNIPQPDWNQVHDWLSKAALGAPKAGLRLNITRGEGGRGYSSLGISDTNIVISHFDYPEHYTQWARTGIELGISEKRLGINPLLAGHKHNNRLEQILAKQDIDKQGLVDGLVLDISGHVVETTMANLFWLKDGKLYTPSMEKNGVSGVMRQQVIEELTTKAISVEVGHYKLSHLLNADEVFMTNSICCVIPVNKILDKTFEVGALTRDLQEKFSS